MDSMYGDGLTVGLCGDDVSNFICYPISDGMRQERKFHCNWGFNVQCPGPGESESWTAHVKFDDVKEQLARMDGSTFGGLTPYQIAERTDTIIKWALFDRDPIDSFDFGNVTLLGDAAHPLLPYGSQGATQAIMDGEALGICYEQAMSDGLGIKGCVKAYSDVRCGPTGKVVLANRQMGSTAVLRVAKEKCEGMASEDKSKWCKENGDKLHNDVIMAYRRSMPTSVRHVKRPRVA